MTTDAGIVGLRQDTWLNTVTIDGVDFGTWDTLQGGDPQAAETKYRPGGMQPEISLGGPNSVNNVTLAKLLTKGDYTTQLRALMVGGRIGKAHVVISRQPLDIDGNPFGDPLVYNGKLMHVLPGDTDSNASGASQWQIVVSTNGSIA